MSDVLQKSSDVESWIICTEDEDADSLVGFELYRNDATLALHETNQNVSDARDQVSNLLADPPVRSGIRPTATSMRFLG